MRDFNKLLITEDVVLLDVLKLFEKTKKKALFLVDDGKLLAAVADGDVRGWLVAGGSLDAKVKEFANYFPIYVKETERDKVRQVMRRTFAEIIPVVDDNMKIVDIETGPTIVVETEKIDSNIAVVINAGGKGTRLYPYTKILPKPLIPIGELPISERIINRFVEIGCEQFYMIINEKKEMIKAYFSGFEEKKWNLEFVEETKPLGTGGGLSLLNCRFDTTFIFINCDTIILADFADIIREHRKNHSLVTMICANMNIKVPYGVIKSEKGRLCEIQEKPELFFETNVGCYIVEPQLLEMIPPGQFLNFPDIIMDCKEKGFPIGVYLIEASEWLDMGQFNTLEDMKKRLNAE